MTVLIVDDNTLIRKWLKIMLQQMDGPSLEVLEAEDGNEALAICLRQTVDLVITDIRMPGMDGISLIKALQTQSPATQSAVLSSYDDFSYVRIALKCGALDYILKAEMQQDDITSLVAKARERIALSRGSDSHLKQFEKHIRNAVKVYNRFLQTPEDSGRELLQTCRLESSGYIMALIQIRDPGPGADILKAAALTCLSLQEAGLQGLAFPIEDEQLLLLYGVPDSGSSQKEQYLRLLSGLEQSLSAARAGILHRNISLQLTSQDDFADRLRYIRSLMDYQIYYQCSTLPDEPSTGSREAQKLLLGKVQTYLAVNSYQQAADCLLRYVTEAHRSHELPRRVRRNASAVSQVLLAAFSAGSHQTDHATYLDRLVQKISTARTADLLSGEIRDFYDCYIHMDSTEKSVSGAITQAINYCSSNFSRKITLEEVASVVHLNKSYFSQLFHKELGVSFGEYLENLRIQNAQKMLHNSSFSMSDIAEKAGFSNQNYFTKVFKKVTGVTPSQYRATLLQESSHSR